MYMEKFDLKGRTAVVTGGGQGIGFACAQALGEAGAKVFVAEIRPERAEQAVASLRKLGISADGATLDSVLNEAFAVVREAAKRTLGQRHYDVQMVGGMVAPAYGPNVS